MMLMVSDRECCELIGSMLRVAMLSWLLQPCISDFSYTLVFLLDIHRHRPKFALFHINTSLWPCRNSTVNCCKSNRWLVASPCLSAWKADPIPCLVIQVPLFFTCDFPHLELFIQCYLSSVLFHGETLYVFSHWSSISPPISFFLCFKAHVVMFPLYDLAIVKSNQNIHSVVTKPTMPSPWISPQVT